MFCEGFRLEAEPLVKELQKDAEAEAGEDEEVILEEEEEEEQLEDDQEVEVEAAKAAEPPQRPVLEALARKKAFLLNNDSAWREDALEAEIETLASRFEDPGLVIQQVNTLAEEFAAEVVAKQAAMLKEAAEKERLVKEAAEKEAAEKEHFAKEAALKEAAAEKERLVKEAALKEAAEKERLAKEAALKEAALKDAALKEAAEKEQLKEAALKEAALKEAALKEAAAKKERLVKEAALKKTPQGRKAEAVAKEAEAYWEAQDKAESLRRAKFRADVKDNLKEDDPEVQAVLFETFALLGKLDGCVFKMDLLGWDIRPVLQKSLREACERCPMPLPDGFEEFEVKDEENSGDEKKTAYKALSYAHVSYSSR